MNINRMKSDLSEILSKRKSGLFYLIAVFIPVCGLFFLAGGNAVNAATDATLQFNQTSISTNVGSIVTLIARVNPGTNQVGAVELDVTFNPTVLRLESITRSSAFNTTLLGPIIDNIGTANTDGNGSIDVGLLTNPATFITSTSDVATFIFTVLSSATSSPIAIASTSNASAHGVYVVSTRTGASVTVAVSDTTLPTFTINDGTSATFIQSDTINVTVSDASGIASRFYGFSADNICNSSDTISTAFSSATNFSIAGNHSDYLCVKATDSSSNANVAYQLIGQLRTDNTSPTFTISDGASATSVKSDTINASVSDSASGVATRFYGFSADNVCNSSDTISTAFTNATSFIITGNHLDYLCLKSTDNAGNIGYNLVGQLHIDNTSPTVVQVTAVPAVTLTDTPSYVFNSTESGLITYGGGCSSSTVTAVSGNNTIVFNPFVRGANYACTIRITDAATNQSVLFSLAPFAVTYRGDINVSKAVDSNDFTLFATDYGKTAYCGNVTDIDGSCIVNSNDFTILADDYGKAF